MTRTGNLPLVRRQAVALIVCSVVSSLSTVAPFFIWSILEDGIPSSRKLSEFAFTFMFVTPIAVAGIAFFGLPLLFVVRRFGWVSTVRQFIGFGAGAGAIWGAITSLILFHVEVLPMLALIGGVNGLIVALLWLGIVHKFRLAQEGFSRVSGSQAFIKP